MHTTARRGDRSIADGILTIDRLVWTPGAEVMYASRILTTRQRWDGTDGQAAGTPTVHDNEPPR
jgi:hypothetical protein